MTARGNVRLVTRLLALAALAILLVAAPAGAVDSASVTPFLNADGTGSLSVGSQTNPPGETWSWDTCDANGTSCVPFATGGTISTAGASPNTVFQATANDGPTATSPVWGGSLVSISEPSVGGAIRANALVTPIPGGWTGGWPADSHETQLAACTDALGTQCTTLTDTHFAGGCIGGAAVIDPAFTGRYLRVADHIVGPDEFTPDYAVSSPYSSAIWPAGPRTSVVVVGVIAPATGPPSATCAVAYDGGAGPPVTPAATPPPAVGPAASSPPAARRQPSATVSLGTTGVALVHASAACTVTLRASRGRVHVQVTKRVTRGTTVDIRMPSTLRRRLGSGRAAFVVLVNGIPRTSRVLTIPA
ncbi:MAG TPA: hypothetical protein VG165_16700 [Solirubrobacteraceae bacterium]|jgi:hypothetical protein|nr:hypothetical protein [Solirubrobacteraceae bacterium]